MPTKVKWDPAKHPRGPIGRFVEVSEGSRTWSPDERLRGLQRGRLADQGDVSELRESYRSGELWQGTRMSELGRTDQKIGYSYLTDPAINDQLRGIGRPSPIEDEDGNSYQPQAYISALDRITDSNQLREDTVVYRAVAGVDDGGPLAGAAPGDQIMDRGYSSTSLDPGISKDFGNDIMEITLPAGTRVGPVSGISPREFGYQMELLIGRGAVFQIDSIEDRPDERGAFSGPVRHIRATLVGYLED